jgi:hypothetical protein
VLLPAIAATATTTEATTATTAGTLLGLVDAQRASAHFVTVQGANGSLRSIVIHLHESKSAGTASLTVIDQSHRVHCTVLTEQFIDLSIRSTKGQVAYIKLLHVLSSPSTGSAGSSEALGVAGLSGRIHTLHSHPAKCRTHSPDGRENLGLGIRSEQNSGLGYEEIHTRWKMAGIRGFDSI